MNTLKVNPWHLCYNSIENVEAYAAPTAIFVAGRNNRNAVEFQRAREKGAEVYAYFNLVERRIERVSALDDAFYMGDRTSAPLWGGDRRGYQDLTMLLDIRVGSEWIKFAVDYIAGILRSRMFDGVFLDVIGGQLHMSDYKNWPLAERQEWAAGAVDAVRLLDQMRRADDETFALVNNNHWNQAPSGEQYVNGICIENPGVTNSDALKPFAARAYSNLGKRRVLTIHKTKELALEWAAQQGVTHVCVSDVDGDGVSDGYGRAGLPAVPCVDLRYDELEPRLIALEQQAAALRGELSATRTLLGNEQAKLAAALEREAILRDQVGTILTQLEQEKAYAAEQLTMRRLAETRLRELRSAWHAFTALAIEP